MKAIMMTVSLLLAMAGEAWAGIPGFSLPTWQNAVPAPIFGRCFFNGQFCGGLSSDLLYYQIPGSLLGKPLPALYVAAAHYGNSNEMIKQFASIGGVYGVNIGTSFGTLGKKALAVVNALKSTPLALPPWADNIDKVMTIEIGTGYRLFGHTRDLNTNFEVFAGARIMYPFNLSIHY